jgi:hypothetical protein
VPHPCHTHATLTPPPRRAPAARIPPAIPRSCLPPITPFPRKDKGEALAARAKTKTETKAEAKAKVKAGVEIEIEAEIEAEIEVEIEASSTPHCRLQCR